MVRSDKRKKQEVTNISVSDANLPGLKKETRYAFLQAVMQASWMKEEAALQLFQKLKDLQGSAASYANTLIDINDNLEFLLMEVRRLKYPMDGRWYVGFVNKESDEVAKNHGSKLTIPQVQFLRGLLEAIALDETAEEGRCSITSTSALYVAASQSQDPTQATQAGCSQAAAGPRLTMSDKEAACKRFVEEGWLAKTPQRTGHLSIGVRAFMELHELLLSFDLPDDTRTAWERIL